MTLNQHRGTSSTHTSTAAVALGSPLVSDAGSHTNAITGIMGDDRIGPLDTLSNFSLGPC